MHRTLLLAAVVAGLTACSSNHPAAQPAPTTVAPTPAPATSSISTTVAAATTSDAALKKQVLECGTFDAGAVYLNDQWDALLAGHVKAGYGISLGRAAITWEQAVADSGGNKALDKDIHTTATAVQDLVSAMAKSSDATAPVDVSAQAQAVKNAFTSVSIDCVNVGYHLTQTLKKP